MRQRLPDEVDLARPHVGDGGRQPRRQDGCHECPRSCRCLFTEPRLERLERVAGAQVQEYLHRTVLEPRAMPVARGVQHDGAAGAEMRPEQRTVEMRGSPSRDPNGETHVMRHAR